MLFFVGIIVTLIITMFGTPSYTAPMLVGTNTRTHGLFKKSRMNLKIQNLYSVLTLIVLHQLLMTLLQ